MPLCEEAVLAVVAPPPQVPPQVLDLIQWLTLHQSTLNHGPSHHVINRPPSQIHQPPCPLHRLVHLLIQK